MFLYLVHNSFVILPLLADFHMAKMTSIPLNAALNVSSKIRVSTEKSHREFNYGSEAFVRSRLQERYHQSSREFILFFPWIPNMSKSVLLSQGALALMSKLPHLIYQKIFRLGILIQREPLKRTEEWRRRQCANHSSFTRGGSSFWVNSWCRTKKLV